MASNTPAPERITLEHNGKAYTLKSRVITAELIDQVTPIREKMREKAQGKALMAVALENEAIFELIDPLTGDMREGITPEAILEFARRTPALMRALSVPTIDLHTDAVGVGLMAKMLAVTVDRTSLSEELKADLDSNPIATVKKVTRVHIDEETGESTTVVDDLKEPRSEFWSQFPIQTLIDYTETFCRRARI